MNTGVTYCYFPMNTGVTYCYFPMNTGVTDDCTTPRTEGQSEQEKLTWILAFYIPFMKVAADAHNSLIETNVLTGGIYCYLDNISWS